MGSVRLSNDIFVAGMAIDAGELQDFLDNGGDPFGDSQSAPSFQKADLPLFASPARLNTEILVNTATAGSQTESRMIALTGGGFVVVWEDNSQGVGGATGDTTGAAIKAQMFDASGAKVGTEILVNTATAGSQNNARVTALTGGGFAVTWVDASAGVGGTGGDTSGTAIKAQLFDATGAKSGVELLVNTTTAGSQNAQQIVALGTGGFVVCWSDSFNSIKTQMFDAAGTKVGAEHVASNPLAGGTQVPQITTLTNGGYVVTWFEVRSSGGGDNDSFRISAQLFDASGAKVGSDILVNTATASSQSDPVVSALADGSFVITWTDFSAGVGGAGGDTASAAIKGQIFDANGAKTGTEFLVNTATAGIQQYSQITTLTDGRFVAIWVDHSAGVGGAGGDTSGTALKAQLFAADGSRIGNEILVNTTTSGNQGGDRAQRLISLSDGGFAVIWHDSSTAIRMQAFDSTGAKNGTELLVSTAAGSSFLPQFAQLANGDIAASWSNGFGSGGATGDNSSVAVKAQVITFNTAPTGADGSINFYEDAVLILNDPVYFGYNDVDGNAFGGVWIDGTSGSGTFTLNGAPLTLPVFVTAAQVAAGNLRFTPAANVSGNDYAAFTFRVTDSEGGTDSVANTRALNILPVNDAPTGSDGSIFVYEDTPLAFNDPVYFGYSDIEGNAFGGVWIDSTSGSGAFTLSGAAITAPVFVTASQIAAGELVFTPALNATGSDYASFSFRVADALGGTDPVANTRAIAIDPINDAPAGTNATLTITEDTARVLTAADFGFTDSDGNALLSVRITTLPGAGTLTLNGAAVTAGSFLTAVDINAGLLVYTPSSNGNGTGYSSFTFQVRDDGGTANGGVDTDQSANTLTFDVTAVNDAPVVNFALNAPVIDQSALDISSGHNISSFVQSNNFMVSGPTTLNILTAYLAESTAAIAGTFEGFSGTLSFAIYRDNGSGLPGTLITTGADLAPVATDTGLDLGGRDLFQFTVNLGGITLTAGNYWIALHEGAWLSPSDGTDLFWLRSANDLNNNMRANTSNVTAPNGTFATFVPGLAFSLSGAPAATEQVSYDLKGKISVADPDAGSGIVTATLSVGYGVLKANAGTSGATVVSGQGTSTLVLSGTIAQINALLGSDATSSVRFIADTDTPPSNTTLTFSVNDGGNTGGAAQTGLASQTLTIVAVNDAPVVDLNGAAAGIDTVGSYTEGGTPIRPLLGMAISDVDNGTLTGATVTIGTGFVAGDLLRLAGGQSGVTGSGITYGYNATTGVLTLSGVASVADYQTTLAGLSFKSNSDDPGTARSISVVVNDGSANSVAASIALTVTPVNDAPVNSIPGGQNGQTGDAIVFSAANGNALTISDVDAGGGTMRVRLSVDSGSLSLSTMAGLTVTGNGTGVIKITGSLAAINAALDGLSYQGAAGYENSATLTITTADSGGLSDTDSVTVLWQAVSQEPLSEKLFVDDSGSDISAAFLPSGLGMNVGASGEVLYPVEPAQFVGPDWTYFA